MPTYPTRTLTLDDATVATLDTYIETHAIDQMYDHALVLGLLWNSAKEPGVVGPMLKLVNLAGKRRVQSQAGKNAVLPLAFAQTSPQYFRGTQTLSTAINPVITEALSIWSYLTHYAAISLTESVENTGPMAVLDIMKERIDEVYRSMSAQLETDFWSTNTDIAAGTQDSLPGIQTYISTGPTTGTVWGLNRATYSWWRNNADTVGSFAANGLDKMRSMYYSCSSTNAVDPPTCIITTPTVLSYAVKQLEGIHRVTNDAIHSAELSTPVASYMGIPVLQTSKVASGYMYFLNLNYLMLLTKKGVEWDVYDPPMPNDQLIAYQKRIVWGGTWGTSRPARHGVLSGITA